MRKFTLLLTVKIASFITVLLFLFDSAVFGYDGDYYTYGTINIVAPAWQMMSLVFSDTSYGSLITAAVLVSGFIVIGGAFVSWYKTGKASFFAWLPQILIGVFLWLIVFNGYGNLTIYDQTLNAFKQVPGVPNGLIFVANVMSTIEKNVVDIVTTAGSPLIPYADGGKGLGFNLFQAAYDLEVQGVPMQENLDKSLNQYNKDCLMFELSQPNPSITPDAIMNSSDLFTTIWALAGNPAIPTLYYNDANPNGTPATCDQAWANISSDLQNSVTSNTLMQSICQSQGFNKSDPNQIARCQTITNEYITALMNNANITTVQNFMIQNKIAQKLDSTIRDIDPIAASSTMATYNAMQSMLGAGQTIPQWMPVARGVFTAIAVSLMPFLCLVIPTALSVRGLKMIIGFFVFLCCWGICDAILHTLLLTLSLNEFAFVQSHNIGFTALMTMPEATTRAVAVYGYILSASILLALFVTTIFVEFGGYALTSMASNITGTIEGAGARGAETSMDPGKSGQYRDSLREGIANTGKADMTNLHEDVMQRAARGVGDTRANISTLEDKGFGGMVDGEFGKTVYNTRKGFGEGTAAIEAGGGKVEDKSYQDTAAGLYQHKEVLSGATGGVFMSENLEKDDQQYATLDTPYAKGITMENGKVTNIDKATMSAGFAQDAKETATKSVGKTIASSVDTSTMWGKTEDLAKTIGVSESDAHKLQQSAGHEFAKNYANNRALQEAKDASTGQSMAGWAQGTLGNDGLMGAIAGGALGWKVQAGGKVQIEGKQTNGKTSTFTLEARDAEAFKNAISESQEKAFVSTFNSSDGLKLAKNISHKLGLTETENMATQFQSADTASATIQQNILPRMINEAMYLDHDRFAGISDPRVRAYEAVKWLSSDDLEAKKFREDFMNRTLHENATSQKVQDEVSQTEHNLKEKKERADVTGEQTVGQVDSSIREANSLENTGKPKDSIPNADWNNIQQQVQDKQDYTVEKQKEFEHGRPVDATIDYVKNIPGYAKQGIYGLNEPSNQPGKEAAKDDKKGKQKDGITEPGDWPGR